MTLRPHLSICSSNRPVRWRLLGATAVALAMCVAPVLAREESSSMTPSLLARYPAGSISSVEIADRALTEAASENSAIEARFAADERGCYSLFFANACRENARERRRLALTQVRPVEVEANAFKRRTRVVERDKALAEKRVQDERDMPLRLQKQQKRDEANSQDAKPVNTDRNKADAGQRTAQHEARLKRLQAEDAANAQKRADNIAAYERKVKEAEARQREVEAKKVEKERERANKQSSLSAQ
jgi:colicin import membrane protein